MRKSTRKLLIIGALVCLPGLAWAQEETPPAAASPEALGQLQNKIDEQQKKIDELLQKDAAREAQFKEQTTKSAAQEETLNELKQQAEAAAPESANAQSADERFFKMYGFFDLSFAQNFYDRDDTVYRIFSNPHPSFYMSNFNVYLKSQMTRQLSALGEIRFSPLPHGYQDSPEMNVIIAEGSPAMKVTDYTRTNTSVLDPFTTQRFNWGGISIERLHLTYSYNDYLNIIAGRFLTPFGIWNIDHGSPVVLLARVPYFMLREMVPLAQTGLQLYGTTFPADDIYFDYAVTVSNGRGPIDAVKDLDDNKGVGLRLRVRYEKDDLNLAFGGYGYYGKYTDFKIATYTDGKSTEENGIFNAQEQITEQYAEQIGTLDLQVNYKGLLLQGEFIRRRVDYDVPIQVASDIKQKKGLNVMAKDYYTPSYMGNGYYGLLAYKLPLSRWLGKFEIIPFFFTEYNDINDADESNCYFVLAGGLNLRPTEFVTLKAEFDQVRPTKELFKMGNWNILMGQMAVSF